MELFQVTIVFVLFKLILFTKITMFALQKSKQMEPNIENIKLKVQKRILIFGVLIMALKFLAYFLTHSVGILTDAFESIVNVVAGAVTLYSLFWASKPRDLDHPFGHGKVELLSASLEGLLIAVAGVLMIIESIRRLYEPVPIEQLDYGILIVALGGITNYVLGYYSIRVGKKHNSIALVAGGKHLQSDTYSTIGLLIGLLLLFLTKQLWLDSLMAIIFGSIIIYTGVKILRESINNLMDRADFEEITVISKCIYENRKPNWIDIHNLRMVKYGDVLHLDCDLTLPWYFNIREAHIENDLLKQIIADEYPHNVDLTIHFDGCKTAHCKHCKRFECDARAARFESEKPWSLESVIDSKATGNKRLID